MVVNRSEPLGSAPSDARPKGDHRIWCKAPGKIKMSKLLILCISCLAWGDDGQPAATPHLPETDWPTIRAERLDVLQRYLGVASGGYEWFAHAMHGEPAGTPYLLMRLLPELAPDLWGAPEDRFAVFGFFDDPRDSA